MNSQAALALGAPSADWNLHAIVKIPENLSAQGGQLSLSPIVSFGGAYSLSLWSGD